MIFFPCIFFLSFSFLFLSLHKHHSSSLLYFLGMQERSACLKPCTEVWRLHITIGIHLQFENTLLFFLGWRNEVKINSFWLFTSFCFSIFAGEEGINTWKPQGTHHHIYHKKTAIFPAPSKPVSMPPSSLWPNPLKHNYFFNHQLCKEPMGLVSSNL